MSKALTDLLAKVEGGECIHPAIVQEFLTYAPDTGLLFWRKRKAEFFKEERHAKAWNSRYAGRQAFTTLVRGYRAGSIANRHVYAHRAAFCVMFGRWPENIDHINGDKTDNRLANLREVTHQLNMRNIPIGSANTSGVIGVAWLKQRNKWLASIGVDGQTVYLGEYKNKDEAIIARAAAEKVLSFHPNHGRKTKDQTND
jgi:hypothetical protein